MSSVSCMPKTCIYYKVFNNNKYHLCEKTPHREVQLCLAKTNVRHDGSKSEAYFSS